MELFFLQAECGDAAYIQYEDKDGLVHYIFIDSGFERTYRYVLSDQIEDVGIIDLFIISHIHNDHIGGAIAYTRAITRGETKDKVKQWCYNQPRAKHLVNSIGHLISDAASISQGDELHAYLGRNQKLPANDILNTSLPFELHGLKITWLSPSEDKLKRLRDKYEDIFLPLEKEENGSISVASAASNSDYHVTIEGFELGGWIEDNNVENGSSIAFLSEHEDSRVLWLADAHPQLIIQSLENLGYTTEKRLKCTYVKVSHHGSKGNNSEGLYDLIDCRHYVISADGTNSYYLPSKESLARILRNKNRDVNSDHYHFYFTYDNSVLRNIFDVDGADVFNRWNFECSFIPAGQKWLKLPTDAASKHP